MRPNVLIITLLCGLGSGIASGASIFISSETVPGSVAQTETEAINISGGGTGSLGIWVIPDIAQTLNGIDLNLRVAELDGNAIDISGVTVLNPTITGAGGAKRWFDDSVFIGVGVDSVSADLVTGMSGVTTSLGAPGEGTGLKDANGANDPLFDIGSGAYLFATVDYDIINTNNTAELFLQISDNGIADSIGLVSSVVFGLVDTALDASNPIDRNVDSIMADATTDTFLAGDFDFDGDVDGADFLKWQRGEVSSPPSASDLADWESNFGTVAPLSANLAVVPEPTSMLLVFVATTVVCFRTRRGLRCRLQS